MQAALGEPISAIDFAARFGLPADAEQLGVNGPAATMLRYLSQGLPGFRGNLSEWSFQHTIQSEKPDEVLCRLWWPRFVAELGREPTGTFIEVVHWIDDPGDCRETILDTAREVFLLKRRAND